MIYMIKVHTLDFFNDNWVAQLQVLSSPDLVKGLDPEVILTVDIEVLDGAGKDVLP